MILTIGQKEIYRMFRYVEEKAASGIPPHLALQKHRDYRTINPFLKKAITRILKGLDSGKKLGPLLRKERFISSIQESVIEHSNSFLQAFRQINEMNEEKKGLRRPIIMAIFWWSMVPLTFLPMAYNMELFKSLIGAMSSLKTNGDPVPSSAYPFFMQDNSYFLVIGWVSIFIPLVVILYLAVMYFFSPKITYKLWPWRETEDGLTIMTAIKNLYEAGMPLQQIIRKMRDETSHRPHKQMFGRIYRGFERGELNLSSEFKRTGFGFEVYDRLSVIEAGGDTMRSLRETVNILKERRKSLLTTLSSALPLAANISAWAIIGMLGVLLTTALMNSYTGVNTLG